MKNVELGHRVGAKRPRSSADDAEANAKANTKANTNTKKTTMFISDAELNEAFVNRLERLKLTCAVCCAEGWKHDEVCAPHAARIMHIPQCGHTAHATCSKCLQVQVDKTLFSDFSNFSDRLNYSDLHRRQSQETFPRVQCLFPFSSNRCAFKYSTSSTISVASDRAMSFWRIQRAHGAIHKDNERRRISKDGTRALVACPACTQQDSVALVAFACNQTHACSHCFKSWCTRCNQLCPVQDACPCLALPDALVSTAFSRIFCEKDGWPLRKNQVDARALEKKIASLSLSLPLSRVPPLVPPLVSTPMPSPLLPLPRVFPLVSFNDENEKTGETEDTKDTEETLSQDAAFYVSCPSCRFKLHKTSACNSLTHCSRTVCNACGVAAHPWEAHLPIDHWDSSGRAGCPQWDTDPYWAQFGFVCVENSCFSEHHECKLSAHTHGIQKMQAARRQLALKRVEHEFGRNLKLT